MLNDELTMLKHECLQSKFMAYCKCNWPNPDFYIICKYKKSTHRKQISNLF